MSPETAPRERPILFSGPLVRALLEGRKSQTRRLVKPQPVHNGYAYVAALGEILCHCDYLPPDCLVQAPHYDHPFLDHPECPYGEPGDRLWVRETWGLHFMYDPLSPSVVARDHGGGDCRFYQADGAVVGGCSPSQCKRWRPSIHMPRWASRIDLEVTSVRVERLQAITEEDARAEGVAEHDGPCDPAVAHRYAFADLWDAINGERASWASNPWVWVVGFRRLEVHRG